jgi:hypothetical protein
MAGSVTFYTLALFFISVFYVPEVIRSAVKNIPVRAGMIILL